MRLWHEKLLISLPKQWLMGQHRECCALRGKGWGKPHSTVNYVFSHNYLSLVRYHRKVMRILKHHYKVKINMIWFNSNYRGVNLGLVDFFELPNIRLQRQKEYPEHDDKYLVECVENLKNKGIEIQL